MLGCDHYLSHSPLPSRGRHQEAPQASSAFRTPTAGSLQSWARGERSPLLPWRRGLTPWVSLECNPEIPVAPGVEHYVLDMEWVAISFSRGSSQPRDQTGVSSENGLEWVNLTQMTIISTTVGRNQGCHCPFVLCFVPQDCLRVGFCLQRASSWPAPCLTSGAAAWL